jgi:hypothetical protein
MTSKRTEVDGPFLVSQDPKRPRLGIKDLSYLTQTVISNATINVLDDVLLDISFLVTIEKLG